MKKHDFKKYALLGLMGGVLLASGGCTNDTNHSFGSTLANQHQMTDQELTAQLSSEGRRIFDSLTPDGKKLALQLANQSCKGKNACKGLNSCKSSTNSCQGLGGCEGTTPGPFKDKNDAVKVAAMATKRQSM